MLNIITFNILSSELAKPDYFPNTDIAHLDADFRFNKLTTILSYYVENNYIICLQEVSSIWHKKFISFFSSSKYYYNVALCVEYDSRLGVAICYPKSLFKTINIHNIQIGEVIDNYVSDHFSTDPLIAEEIVQSKQQLKRLLIIEILCLKTDKKLFIANYHMPCKFTKPTLMELHILFCIKSINEIVVDNPVLFVGDFNSKYGFNEWLILTKGNCNSNLTQELLKKYPICSLYFNDSLEQVIDRIPTCYNQVNKQIFILDYIFYRNLTYVSSSVVTKHTFPIPSETYPSDHLPVIASLNFKN